MRAAEKRSALHLLLNAQGTADALRNQLRSLGEVVGAAKDVDALLLKLGSVLDASFLEVAQSPVDPEPRDPEQQAADARAAAVKAPT